MPWPKELIYIPHLAKLIILFLRVLRQASSLYHELVIGDHIPCWFLFPQHLAPYLAHCRNLLFVTAINKWKLLLPGRKKTFVEFYLLLRSELYISRKLNLVLKKDGKLNIHYFKNPFKTAVRGIFLLFLKWSIHQWNKEQKRKRNCSLKPYEFLLIFHFKSIKGKSLLKYYDSWTSFNTPSFGFDQNSHLYIVLELLIFYCITTSHYYVLNTIIYGHYSTWRETEKLLKAWLRGIGIYRDEGLTRMSQWSFG